MSTRDDILAIFDRKPVAVLVPEWGNKTFFVQPLSGGERDQMETWLPRGAARTPDFRAKVAAMVITDESGNKLFTPADVPALTKKSGSALDRILDAVLKLSGLGPEAVEDSKKD